MMRRFWNAAIELDPAAADRDEGRRFEISRPERLQAIAERAGFGEVATRPIDIMTRFRDFEDYWGPFLGGVGPAPDYALSLTEARRTALRERLRSTLPVKADGTIEMIARAWAVRGVARS